MKQNLITYLITYDIKDSKARNRVLKALRKLSLGYQRSVFECTLNRKQLKSLIDYLYDNTEDDDRLLITRLYTEKPEWTLGNQQLVHIKGCLWII
jgi:CRISPR-associated endonuclease Cas2